MILDAGCGSLSDHKRRSGIGVDLERGACDIVCDLAWLPLRDNTFTFVYARNILEHLVDPFGVMFELERVMVKDGRISVTVPVYHNVCVDELLKLVFGFPFRLLHSFLRLLRWRKNGSKRGFGHLNRIEPKHISSVFEVMRCEPMFCVHPVSRYLHKVGLVKGFVRYPFPDIWYIFARCRVDAKC